MKSFEVQESHEGKCAWIYPEADGEYEPVHGEPEPDRLAIKIKHVSPRSAESLERKMIQAGVLRKVTKRGGISITEVSRGREQDRDRLYAEAYVADWQGFTQDKKPLAYSPEALAALLGSEVWLNKAIGKATEEFESFFVGNGNGTSKG